MSEPILIIMAAGMGSRYGGLKQIDPISGEGEIIMDFSLYDAMKAGFKKVIFVIKTEMEEDFKKLIDGRAGKFLETEFVFQDISDIPEGFTVPEGRDKPWGTSHAILSCRKLVKGPFAVINADDFYGAGGFQLMYDFLKNLKDDSYYQYGMIGYPLKNTLTEHGHVARGVCQVDGENFLTHIVERTKIMRKDGGIRFTEDEKTWEEIPGDSIVSMNFWGFTQSMMNEMEKGFPEFLNQTMKVNPLKGEYLLPEVAEKLLRGNKAKIRVMKSDDPWHGVTYKEDKEFVVAEIQALKDKGRYPQKLWI